MFTGIIETLGTIVERKQEGSNVHFRIQSSISYQVDVDNSIAHNGVCLTITKVENNSHWVTAIDETLKHTSLGGWNVGTQINLERSLLFNGRVDGHFVQGHVDTTAVCKNIEDLNGSWKFTFELLSPSRLLIHKGSVSVNGVSLTVIEPSDTTFSIAIIPFTFEHTTFKEIKVGDQVNIEFDIIGKHLERWALPFLESRH